jgi:hypothetical protein
MTEIRPPVELAWLTDVIGADAALVMIERFGGTRLRIPVQPDKPTLLSEAVGIEAQAKLVAAFGGDRLRIPLLKWWRARIYRWEQGMSIPQIARKLGMVESGVQSLLRSSQAAQQLGRGPVAHAGGVPAQMALPLADDAA